MIRFIDEHKGQFGVESICRVLGAMECGFITSRGYRAAKARPRCARAIRDEVLIDEIRRVHQQNYGVYGQRKMWHAMRRQGWMIGRDQTARLMKVAGLHGVRRGRRPFTTVASKLPDHRPDLVERDFHAMAPNELWVADITYVRTVGGFAYTAFITDACTRKIVGWSVASSLTTQALNRPGFGGGCHSTRGWTAWQHHGSTRQSFKSARHVSRSKLAKIRNGDEEQYAGWPSSSV